MEEVVENAVRCTVCGANADRYGAIFICQANKAHLGDTFVGIFTDLTYPEENEDG